MDAVKSFNDELSSIYETKPPVSRAKMTILTKKAIKGIKFYKHIVQSMEKFIQKCRPEYKVPGLYVIDSVVRQSRHQFGQEKDVFMPRLCKNILVTFKHLYKCPQEEKQRIIRVLNLWQKNSVFPPDIVQQLLVMGGAPTPESSTSQVASFDEPVTQAAEADTTETTQTIQTAAQNQPDASSLTNMLAQLLANPDNPQIQQLTGLLSTSQQAQLQALVHQVKEKQGPGDEEKPPSQSEPAQPSVFQISQNHSQPPFLQSQKPETGPTSRPPPSFNRAVLDYDYSDDESPKANEQNPSHHHHRTPGKPGIDLELLAKLPTVDQLQQLTSSSGGMTNGDGFAQGGDAFPRQQGEGFPRQQDEDRRRRLEQEQAVFDKQIQQMSTEFAEGDKSSQDGRSSRSASRRRRSRSHSRHRHRRRSRSRSRDRSRRSRRSKSREHKKSRHKRDRSVEHGKERDRERDRERERKGLPPMREGCVSLCTKTLWIGNLSSKVTQQEIRSEVEAFGAIESFNMIPPRGCAYICMEKREDASRALHKLRHVRIGGKAIKVDWAPGKNVPEEFKEFWVKEDGVNYIPIARVGDLTSLQEQGFIDMETVPEDKRGDLEKVIEIDAKPGESEEAPVVMGQPGLMQAAPGVHQVQGMMPGTGGVPVMMRAQFPFPGMNQYMPQQQMPRFQMGPNMANTPRPQILAPEEPPKVEISGSRTPTRDEKGDEISRPIVATATLMTPTQPPMQQQFTMAQPRFQGMGQVPMQIRMMPGMHPGGPQVMPGQRIGMNVMPIRMGMPMHFRPGFPPGVRVPISPQSMMPFQQQQHMQMQRMGPMVQRMHPPMQMHGGPMQIRGPLFPPQMGREIPPEDDIVIEEEVVMEDPSADDGTKKIPDGGKRSPGPQGIEVKRPSVGEPPQRIDVPPERMPGMGGRPPIGDRPPMDERPPRMDRPPHMGERPPMDDRPPRMDRPPHMGDRHPMDDRPPPGFRRSPGRFGFDGRRPMDGPPMNRPPPDGDRFRDRDRRDDVRRKDRSPDRRGDRDRRDRGGMRESRFERDDRDRDRFERRGGFGDRGDRWGDRGGRFGGRDGFQGGRGGGRGGFGGDGFRGGGRFEDEVDEEEEEYKKKREEVLKKRHEDEDEYVAETIDLSAFGLPPGFGAIPPPEKEESNDSRDRDSRRSDRDDSRRRDRGDRDRRDDRDRRERSDRRRDDRHRDDRRDSRHGRDRRRDSKDRKDDRDNSDRRDDRRRGSADERHQGSKEKEDRPKEMDNLQDGGKQEMEDASQERVEKEVEQTEDGEREAKRLKLDEGGNGENSSENPSQSTEDIPPTGETIRSPGTPTTDEVNQLIKEEGQTNPNQSAVPPSAEEPIDSQVENEGELAREADAYDPESNQESPGEAPYFPVDSRTEPEYFPEDECANSPEDVPAEQGDFPDETNQDFIDRGASPDREVPVCNISNPSGGDEEEIPKIPPNGEILSEEKQDEMDVE